MFFFFFFSVKSAIGIFQMEGSPLCFSLREVLSAIPKLRFSFPMKLKVFLSYGSFVVPPVLVPFG